MTREIKLDLPAIGGKLAEGKVVIDNQDVSHAVAGLILNAQVGEPTTLLICTAATAAQVKADGEIVFQPELRALLIAAGWTPPAPAREIVEQDGLRWEVRS